MSYRVNLFQQDEPDEWRAEVEFKHYQNGLGEILDDIALHHRLPTAFELENYDDGFTAKVGRNTLNDDFGNQIAATVRTFIEVITPAVDDAMATLEDENNEQDV